MNIQQRISDLAGLSVDERLQIVQALWDSIPSDREASLTAAQATELQRRIAAHDQNPGSAISRDELERRIKERQ